MNKPCQGLLSWIDILVINIRSYSSPKSHSEMHQRRPRLWDLSKRELFREFAAELRRRGFAESIYCADNPTLPKSPENTP